MLDVDQSMGIAPGKPNHASLRVHGDTIAICILFGRRDDRPHWNLLELADSQERVTNLSPFDSDLMFVANVLVNASAAPAEIGTLWFHAMRRTLLHLDQFRFGKLLFLPHDFGRNELAFDSVRNKDSLTLLSRDAFSAESDVFDFQTDKPHLIDILLQLGGPANQTLRTALTVFHAQGKPLKRLTRDGALITALKREKAVVEAANRTKALPQCAVARPCLPKAP